jgi:hypothetical protein
MPSVHDADQDQKQNSIEATLFPVTVESWPLTYLYKPLDLLRTEHFGLRRRRGQGPSPLLQ